MRPRLFLHALPSLVEPAELAGAAVVVIDVLRASTTIVHALEAGAKEVIACLEVDEARSVAQGLSDGEAVLGGERDGLPIDGFQLSNSPGQYTSERVGGKVVVLTTTNGTRAILHARQADRVLIGGFVNATAVYGQLVQHEQIHLLCAGANGQMAHDDILLAGMLVERLQRQGGLLYEQNAQAATARETWLYSFALPMALGAEPLEPERLAQQLRKSTGGKRLVAIGMESDILTAAQIDRFDGVPELDPQKARIRLT